jgi:hypothetical protein
MVVDNKKFWCGIVCNSRGGGGVAGGILPQNFFCIFLPLGLQFVHFLKQIFGYTVLHYAVA